MDKSDRIFSVMFGLYVAICAVSLIVSYKVLVQIRTINAGMSAERNQPIEMNVRYIQEEKTK